MPDTKEDRTVQRMEADIASMAARLAPIQEGRERPRVGTGGLSTAVEPIGAGAVGKRLEELLMQAHGLLKRATVLEIALAGALEGGIAPEGARGQPPKTAHPDAPLFRRQMAALDEIAGVLDSLGRSLERAQHSLG